jgi:hypothetical protein
MGWRYARVGWRHARVGWHHEGVDVDELYGLPLERFVPERNALAREQRNAGLRDEATEVAGLRKPSVAAWAVNQLVRTQRRGVDDLFEAGDGLREVHDAVLEGRGDGSSLRGAVERERLAVEALIEAARGLLTSDGHELSPTIIDRVADTLHAAALDEDARRQVEDGRLERELRHVGLGAAAGPPAPARARPGSGRAAETSNKRAGATRDTERALRERAQARAEARAEARAVEREARRRLERAERSAKLALERRDRAAQSLEDAEAELADAEDELREAQAQLEDAERAVQDTSD